MNITGIVSDITNDIITVKTLGDEAACAGCSTGGCASCSTASGRTGKTYKTRNTGDLPLKVNSVVEISLPPGKAFAALMRVIFMPAALFAACYILVPSIFEAGEGAQIAGGFFGLIVGMGINFLMAGRTKEKEMPVITKLYS